MTESALWYENVVDQLGSAATPAYVYDLAIVRENHTHLRAALPVGLRLRRCGEPRPPAASPSRPPAVEGTDRTVGPWELWPWCLADLVPEAWRAAHAGVPAMIIWHFQAAES